MDNSKLNGAEFLDSINHSILLGNMKERFRLDEQEIAMLRQWPAIIKKKLHVEYHKSLFCDHYNFWWCVIDLPDIQHAICISLPTPYHVIESECLINAS